MLGVGAVPDNLRHANKTNTCRFFTTPKAQVTLLTLNHGIYAGQNLL